MWRTLRLPPSTITITAPLALLAGDVVVGHGGHAKLLAAAAIAMVVGVGAVVFLSSWSRLVRALLGVILLIPNDGRYVIHAGLPFQLEPYRAVVGFFLLGWLVSLLVDKRVQARRTTFEGPLILIAIAIFGSELANGARVIAVSSFVIKALWLFLCTILAVYMIVSVVRTRETLEKLVTWMVRAGCVVALGAVIERETHNNLFNHLHSIVPILTFNVVPDSSLVRNGHLRAMATAGHPIELSSTMSMLLPLAVYLAISRGNRRWWGAVALLLLGEFSTGSRTGILGLLAMVVVFICLRPRETLRAWPALIPIFAVVHVADPGALGGVYSGFFPSGGLIAQQSGTFHGTENSRLSRWGSSMHEFGEHNPLFGEGYGTRLTGNLSAPGTSSGAGAASAGPSCDLSPGTAGVPCSQLLDDQWLKSLLEVGLAGFVGWIWLFGRVIRRLAKHARRARGTPDGWLSVGLIASILGFVVSMATYDAFSFIQATFVLFTLIAVSSVLLQLEPARPRGAAPPDPHRTRKSVGVGQRNAILAGRRAAAHPGRHLAGGSPPSGAGSSARRRDPMRRLIATWPAVGEERHPTPPTA